ncbi:unnamed protein product [Spodoptera exigua]|nr:unnamed protein product [Spodoptera exigua]
MPVSPIFTHIGLTYNNLKIDIVKEDKLFFLLNKDIKRCVSKCVHFICILSVAKPCFGTYGSARPE